MQNRRLQVVTAATARPVAEPALCACDLPILPTRPLLALLVLQVFEMAKVLCFLQAASLLLLAAMPGESSPALLTTQPVASSEHMCAFPSHACHQHSSL